MATVTPWEVSGNLDYMKLIKDFGLSRMRELPDIFQENVLFRRGVVFAHRDFQRILTAIKDKKPFVMLTGLMPSGMFHVGHMLLALQMIFYQKLGGRIYITVADVESFATRNMSYEEGKKVAIEQYLLNYIALGLDPNKVDFYFQSHRSDDAKKASAYYRLQNSLSRHITFNEVKGIYGDISPAKMLSALLQAADILHPQLPEFEGPIPTFVPAGVDQDPHLRLTRDLASRFKEHKFIQVSSTYHVFMPGLKGGKMSSSDPNSYIALTDDEKTVAKKINKYALSGGRETLEEHRKHGGNPDVDMSFQYLKFFFEPDDKKLANIEADYRSGKLLSGELKKLTIEKINTFLRAHQKAREKASKKITP